jgi:hypothetical protein
MWREETGFRLKRDELYKQVWATPMRTLAKRYGISDVGLNKICRKLNVPVPGLGYWAKIQAGQEVPQPKLPPLKAGQPSEHVIAYVKQPLEIEQDSEAYEKIAFENDPRSKITVARRLMKPHPLVERTERAIKPARLEDSGPTFPREKGCLDIEVSRGNLNRALRVMDALLKALEARGYKVSVINKDRKQITLATVLEEEIEFGSGSRTASEREKRKKTHGVQNTSTIPRESSP